MHPPTWMAPSQNHLYSFSCPLSLGFVLFSLFLWTQTHKLNNNHKPQNDALQWLSSLTRGLLHNIKHDKSKIIIEKPIHISWGENSRIQVWSLRHCPHKVQIRHGCPYKKCAHKEGSVVLLLCIFNMQLWFTKQAHEGAQLEPSLCHWWWGMSQLPHPWGV